MCVALHEDHWSDVSGEHFPESVMRRQGVNGAVGAAWPRCVPCPWWQLTGLVLLKSLICFLLVSKSSQ